MRIQSQRDLDQLLAGHHDEILVAAKRIAGEGG